MTIASGALPRRITGCMKPSSITAGTAGKRIMHDMSCVKPASAAGTSAVAGGMKTAAAGTTIVTGTIMTMIAVTTTNNSGPKDHKGALLWAGRLFSN